MSPTPHQVSAVGGHRREYQSRNGTHGRTRYCPYLETKAYAIILPNRQLFRQGLSVQECKKHYKEFRLRQSKSLL